MLKNILAAIGVLALLAFTANACVGQVPPNSTPNTDAWPPLRFQGDNTATVLYVDPALIDALCGKAPDGWKTEACTTGNTTILPNPCAFPRDDPFAQLACHEAGHLPRINHKGEEMPGWPANHGDARARL